MNQNQEPPSKTWIVGCLSAAAIIIAAIIGLGAPFAERLADVYFPSPTPSINLVGPITSAGNSSLPPTSVPASTQAINMPTQSSNTNIGGILTNCSVFQNGESRKVSLGTFVIGDIIIDGTAQFDSGKVGEGTVAYFEKDATVLAQWGAGCYLGGKALIEEVIQGEFQHGCGSKCTSVRFVLVQSDGQQQVQYYNK
jgi:hypothetical protein